MNRPSALLVLAASLALLGATPAPPPIRGTAGADRLGGTNGAERIEAGEGNDTIFAGDGNDVVRGGPGRDSIELGAGNDVLLLAPGDGLDQLAGFDNAASRVDAVVFAKTIRPQDVVLTRQPVYGLVIQYGRNDKLVVPRHFEIEASTGFRLDAIRFANGQVWDGERIKREVLAPRPTAQYIVGYSASETLDGGAGNDQMYGGFGNDQLLGGAGNDRLYGDEGDDVLAGGLGNDLMRGEKGSDTYIYRDGDGLDAIQNFSNEGDVDVLRFVNHTRAGVEIKAKGTDLILTVNGDPKQGVRLIGFNGSATLPITRIEYREGKPTLLAEMQSLFPKVARRLNSREQPQTATARPRRDTPAPRATHRIRTPLEGLAEQPPSPATPASSTDGSP